MVRFEDRFDLLLSFCYGYGYEFKVDIKISFVLCLIYIIGLTITLFELYLYCSCIYLKETIMENKQLDLELVASFYRKRKIASIPGYRYYEHLPVILAMRELGIKHRIIADYLNVVVVNSPNKITNTVLCAYISKWKQHGLINIHKRDVKELADKIVATELGAKVLPSVAEIVIEKKTNEINKWSEQGSFAEPVKEEVDPFAISIPVDEKTEEVSEIVEEKRLNIIEFMKAVEKKLGRVMSESEKELAKNHYNDPFNQNLIANDVLVSSFIDSIKV